MTDRFNHDLDLQDLTPDSVEAGAMPIPEADRPAAFKKFAIFSAIGVLLFLVPYYFSDQWTIGIGILATLLKGWIGDYLDEVVLVIGIVSVVGTLLVKFAKPQWANEDIGWASIFNVSWIWVLLRVIGALFIVMIYFKIGPEWVISDYTGGVILNDLNPTLIPFFFFAILLMAFLTDYGFMEYIGTLLSKVFRTLFRLPGRAAVDASASWLGAAPVGVLITSMQYDKGYYNEREAATIATSFSIASAAFCLIVAEVIKINEYFLQFYLTVIITCGIVAMIMARIPPLSRKTEAFYVGDGSVRDELRIEGLTLHQTAVRRGMRRAYRMPSLAQALHKSSIALADVYLGLLPVVFALGTVALALSEYTPIFTWLSYPLIPILEVLRVPEAAAAAPAFVVGFADMFLPAVLGKGIESEMTRFIIACMSVAQVIYMTEVGALILKSNIRVNFAELLLIFVMRTVLALPIVVVIAHMLF